MPYISDQNGWGVPPRGEEWQLYHMRSSTVAETGSTDKRQLRIGLEVMFSDSVLLVNRHSLQIQYKATFYVKRVRMRNRKVIQQPYSTTRTEITATKRTTKFRKAYFNFNHAKKKKKKTVEKAWSSEISISMANIPKLPQSFASMYPLHFRIYPSLLIK